VDALIATFGTAGEEVEDDTVKISIVGKPNVASRACSTKSLGKSAPSLAQSLVYRDAIDTI